MAESARSRFTFIGNVSIGDSNGALPLHTLTPHYDALLFAHGAPFDRELGVPGERSLSGPGGIVSARNFVGWYNGHPDCLDLPIAPLLADSESAVVLGQGNVALDVARILLSGADMLRHTDMATHALESLARSRVRRVVVIGRRGPVQAAFAVKELREMLDLKGVAFEPLNPVEGVLPPDDVAAKLPRASKRLVQLLAKRSEVAKTAKASVNGKSWALDFFRSPAAFHADPARADRLSHITFTCNIPTPPYAPFSPDARVTPLTHADGTPQIDTVPTTLAFRSIGYAGTPISGMEELGVQFDSTRGRIQTDGCGRIVGPTRPEPGSQADSEATKKPAPLPGLYSTGWAARGPTGVIATTMTDAFATADAIVADHAAGRPFLNGDATAARTVDGRGWDAVRFESLRRGLRPTSWTDWQRIDSVERERARAAGESGTYGTGEGSKKVRDKICNVEEMLAVL